MFGKSNSILCNHFSWGCWGVNLKKEQGRAANANRNSDITAKRHNGEILPSGCAIVNRAFVNVTAKNNIVTATNDVLL